VDWWCLDSRGASSGILFMWDKKVVEKIDECVGGVYTMAVTFRNVEDHFTWAFAGVYGPNFDRYRRLLWDKMANMLSWWNLPWCVVGDFNVTRFPSERLGEARSCPAMM
jgi:hypothetical protein